MNKLRIVFVLIGVFYLVVSCGVKKTTGHIEEKEAVKMTRKESKNLMKEYENHIFKGETVNAKISAFFDDGNTAMGATISLRMQKDQTIWLSVSKLGFTVAKAFITPTRVQYYEKLQGVYFDGDFSLIQSKLGVSLTFQQLQNVLLGQVVEDWSTNDYTYFKMKDAYEVKLKEPNSIFDYLFMINATNFKVNQQRVFHKETQRTLALHYAEYQTVDRHVLPKEVVVTAFQKQKRTKITMDYKYVQVGKVLRFPFRIPQGYKRIEL